MIHQVSELAGGGPVDGLLVPVSPEEESFVFKQIHSSPSFGANGTVIEVIIFIYSHRGAFSPDGSRRILEFDGWRIDEKA